VIFGVWRRVALGGWAATLGGEFQSAQQSKRFLLRGMGCGLVWIDRGLGG